MQSDNQLIRNIKRKQNKEAADVLIGRYYKEIYAFAYKQLGNRELAMDLTQEIFILVLQGIGSFDEKKANFRTWAYRIASNKITDYYRSSAHKRSTLEQPLYASEDSQGEEPEEAFSQQMTNALVHDLSERIIQRELIQQIMAVVVKYELEWILIFQKKCFEEMTFTEIAKDLHLSVNTVKTRFYSMLKKIKQEVAMDE